MRSGLDSGDCVVGGERAGAWSAELSVHLSLWGARSDDGCTCGSDSTRVDDDALSQRKSGAAELQNTATQRNFRGGYSTGCRSALQCTDATPFGYSVQPGGEDLEQIDFKSSLASLGVWGTRSALGTGFHKMFYASEHKPRRAAGRFGLLPAITYPYT